MPKSIGEYEEKRLRTRVHGSSKGAALSVVLDTIGVTARTIEIWVKSSGAAIFNIYGSQDGINYRHCDEEDLIELTEAGQDHDTYDNAYRFIKVATTAENDNEIEIVAQR